MGHLTPSPRELSRFSQMSGTGLVRTVRLGVLAKLCHHLACVNAPLSIAFHACGSKPFLGNSRRDVAPVPAQKPILHKNLSGPDYMIFFFDPDATSQIEQMTMAKKPRGSRSFEIAQTRSPNRDIFPVRAEKIPCSAAQGISR